ncbi:hypothetical protein Leryth_008054 [Lithospermum erythrorhizon]|nr:hypothetical protein Leryth_008054 [Lithospermum erythrorhizon]
MATLPTASLLLLLSLSNILLISSSNVASDQLSFWSKNVRNIMPKLFLTKLSPLSVPDSDYYTSLLSQQTFTFYSNYCSKASVACDDNVIDTTLSSSTRSFKNGYLEDMIIPSSSQDKVDPNFFFRLSHLEDGKIVRLPDLKDQFPSRAFLPTQMASKITLTTNEIQKLFPKSFSSLVMKEAIESSVLLCNAPTNNLKAGEVQGCVKSLEEMIEFSKNSLGAKQLISLTSKSTKGSGKEVIIGSKNKIDTKEIIYCHETFLPFVTYFCHMQAGYGLYSVNLIEPGNNKNNVPINSVLAVCHMDTSAWPADHVALKLLKLSPGKGEVCHFYSQMDAAFIGG